MLIWEFMHVVNMYLVATVPPIAALSGLEGSRCPWTLSWAIFMAR